MLIFKLELGAVPCRAFLQGRAPGLFTNDLAVLHQRKHAIIAAREIDLLGLPPRPIQSSLCMGGTPHIRERKVYGHKTSNIIERQVRVCKKIHIV